MARYVHDQVMRSFDANPKTKDDWREVLQLLYTMWRAHHNPVTFYPASYCRGALRLDGIVGIRSIGQIVH